MDSFVPRGGLYQPRETSRLNSMRDRGSPAHGWKNDLESARRNKGLTNQLSQLKSELARTRYQQRTGTNGMYPLKVYNFPSDLRIFHNADDWRRIKVRGAVEAMGPQNGTDRALDGYSDQFIWSGELPPSNSAWHNTYWHEVIVPAWDLDVNTEYEVFFSKALPTTGMLGIVDNIYSWGFAFGKIGESPQTVTIMETGETFSDATNTSGSYRKRIAAVNAYPVLGILSGSGLTIYQTAVDLSGMAPFDHESVGSSLTGSTYRGGYDASTNYFVGDVVWEDRSETAAFGDAGTHTYRYLSIYNPAFPSIYLPYTLLGPLNNIPPNGNSPDPWIKLSRSKIA